MDQQHGQAAGICTMDIQPQKCSTDVQHEYAAWTSNMDTQRGHAAVTCSMDPYVGMDMRLGHAAWNHMDKHHGHAVFHLKDIEHGHAAQTFGIDIHLHVVWICIMQHGEQH
jgi:hypothetical protein